MVAKIYDCKIERAIDGDSFILMLNLGFDCFRSIRSRIKGMDTPETNSKDPEMKAKALEAKAQALKLNGTAAKATVYGLDNYGRYVVDLQTVKGDWAKVMLDAGLATPVIMAFNEILHDCESEEQPA